MEIKDAPFFTGRNGAVWYVSLLGGLKREDRWEMPKDMRFVGVLGGVNADLTGAELPENPTLTKFSLVGGVSLRLPQDVDVVVEGFHLFGTVRVEPRETSLPARNTVKVRAYGLVGGVHAQR